MLILVYQNVQKYLIFKKNKDGPINKKLVWVIKHYKKKSKNYTHN